MHSNIATPAEDVLPASSTQNIEIHSLRPSDDATAFRTLNEEWIMRYFVLEPKDVETLSNPHHSILGKGGHIFMVYAGGEAVGCVALIPMKDGVYELSKMAVSPQLRGQGIGRRLLLHAIEQARVLGAKSLFLGSSTKLKNAVHLYEAVGFRHVDPATCRRTLTRALTCSWRWCCSRAPNGRVRRGFRRGDGSCGARRGLQGRTGRSGARHY